GPAHAGPRGRGRAGAGAVVEAGCRGLSAVRGLPGEDHTTDSRLHRHAGLTPDEASMPEAWCRPTAFVDSDAPAVVAFARDAAGSSVDVRERAVALYYAVRDSVTYTPYCDFRSPDTYRASAVLAKGAGFCVGKAALLTAVARAEGIPARLRFADVRNHLCT